MAGTHIHLWSVTENVDELAALCRDHGIDTGAMPACKAVGRRTEIMVEHLLLWMIYGKPVELCHTPQGRPYVPDSGKHLSITHTKGLVCVAVNSSHDVGIDVEKRGRRVLKVRERFLNEIEQQFIRHDDAEATLVAWTAKEALYKVAMNPEATMRDHFVLDAFEPVPGRMLTFTATSAHRAFVLKTLSINDYILTLAIEQCDDAAVCGSIEKT